MPKLKIVGAKYGLQKIEMTKIIRANQSLGLAEAKRCTDDVLEGKVVSFEFDNLEAAKELADALENIGAVVEVEAE